MCMLCMRVCINGIYIYVGIVCMRLCMYVRIECKCVRYLMYLCMYVRYGCMCCMYARAVFTYVCMYVMFVCMYV